MGRPDFGQPAAYLAPPVAHALYDNDVDVNAVDEDLAKVVDDGLPVEPAVEPKSEPALPLRSRWRVPLTRVHNPSGVLLLYRDQLDAQTLNQVMIHVKVYGSIVIHSYSHKSFDVKCKCVGHMRSHMSESWLTSFHISA